MSKSGILDALKDEEKSLRTQLVAIQRAIEALEGADAPAPAGRGKKKALKVVTKRKRTMTEEQRLERARRLLGIEHLSEHLHANAMAEKLAWREQIPPERHAVLYGPVVVTVRRESLSQYDVERLPFG